MEFRLKLALQRRIDVVDQVVDDLVGTQFDAVLVGEPTRGRAGLDVERHHHPAGGNGQVDVVLGDGTHAGEHDVRLHLLVPERFDRLNHRLHRAVGVGFDDDVELLDGAVGELAGQVFQPEALGHRGLLTRRSQPAGCGDAAGFFFASNDRQLVSGSGHPADSNDLDRAAGEGGLDAVAVGVNEIAGLAALQADDVAVADVQFTGDHQGGGDRSHAAVETGFDDRGPRRPGNPGLGGI